MATLRSVEKIASRIEKLVGVDAELETFAVQKFRSGVSYYGDFWFYGRTLSIYDDLVGLDLEEVVAHEMGHAYWFLLEVPFKIQKRFTSRKVSHLKYLIGLQEGDPQPTGFVSAYAAFCREEDFAETFAAYIVNKGKVSGLITFEGKKINLDRDSKLKNKFLAIREVINWWREVYDRVE